VYRFIRASPDLRVENALPWQLQFPCHAKISELAVFFAAYATAIAACAPAPGLCAAAQAYEFCMPLC
jgi:hypothetical protein